jgi:hypothetical protein
MSRLSDEFCFTLITSDPALAERADAAGIDCIGVDIERLNKSAWQRHIPNARISDHELSDLGALRSVARRAAMFAHLISTLWTRARSGKSNRRSPTVRQ